MDDKIISFVQFCEIMKKELLQNMPEEYRTGHYNVVVEETKDTYNQISTWLYIVNEKKALPETPRISMEAAYENMKQVKDVRKIINMVAAKYEKQYAEAVRKEAEKYDDCVDFDIHKLCVIYVTQNEAEADMASGYFVKQVDGEYTELHVLISDEKDSRKTAPLTNDQVAASGVGADELYSVAVANTPELLPLTVRRVSMNLDYDKTVMYCLNVPAGTRWELYEKNTLESLSEQTNSHLYVVSISANTKLALCADSVQVIEETDEVLAEMNACGFGLSKDTLSLYDCKNKCIVTEKEEIAAIVGQSEKKKKSIFNIR